MLLLLGLMLLLLNNLLPAIVGLLERHRLCLELGTLVLLESSGTRQTSRHGSLVLAYRRPLELGLDGLELGLELELQSMSLQVQREVGVGHSLWWQDLLLRRWSRSYCCSGGDGRRCCSGCWHHRRRSCCSRAELWGGRCHHRRLGRGRCHHRRLGRRRGGGGGWCWERGGWGMFLRYLSFRSQARDRRGSGRGRCEAGSESLLV